LINSVCLNVRSPTDLYLLYALYLFYFSLLSFILMLVCVDKTKDCKLAVVKYVSGGKSKR